MGDDHARALEIMGFPEEVTLQALKEARKKCKAEEMERAARRKRTRSLLYLHKLRERSGRECLTPC